MSNAIVPIMSVNDALVRYEAVKHLASEVMVKGVDYGVIPGTNKPTLLKPGAEKLCSFFGMSPFFEITEKVTDWTGKEFNGEPFFYFSYCCSLHLHGVIIAQGEGSCNSWEKKYRWRNAGRVCPNCGQMAISKSQFTPKNKPNEKPGFFCNAKNGGCNAQFAFNDPAILNQETGKMPNPDIADVVNTLQKMAQKRALIAAVLIGANASEFFTQDLEDFTPAHIDGDWLEVKTDKETGEITQKAATTATKKATVTTVKAGETGERVEERMVTISSFISALVDRGLCLPGDKGLEMLNAIPAIQKKNDPLSFGRTIPASSADKLEAILAKQTINIDMLVGEYCDNFGGDAENALNTINAFYGKHSLSTIKAGQGVHERVYSWLADGIRPEVGA